MNSTTREAWELISEILWSEEQHRRFHTACADIDVSPPMLKALTLLEPGAPRPMRAIADLLQCDASWVTSLVDGLEQRGFVERRTSPSDRRVKEIVLTAEGEGAKKRARDRLLEPPASFGALTAAEGRQLRDLLRKASGLT